MIVISEDRRSWVDGSHDSPFPLQNLPYGVFTRSGTSNRRIGVAIGSFVLDLYALAEAGLFEGAIEQSFLQSETLNALLGLTRREWDAVRERVARLLDARNEEIRRAFPEIGDVLVAQGDVRMHLPVSVGDYVDFYSSLEHATNLGKIFRPNGEALMPNWKWLPIGYHGRSGTIVIDGTPIVRPSGQRKPPDADVPTFGPSASLDIELELGFVTGAANALGTAVPADRAAEVIFGLLLVNDWSARDIQAWEYQPLGPFLGKSFATSVSPWIVTLDALEPYRVSGPQQDPHPLPYLQTREPWNYDISLEVVLQTRRMAQAGEAPVEIARSNSRYLYWNFAQQLAHATVNGAVARAGDLFASGTISGSDAHSYGSLIELTWRGARPIELPNGERRAFLEDGDTVTLRACASAPGKAAIGFGEVRGTIVP